MRSKNNKVFTGILGGFGKYFNINPLFLRIIYSILTLNSFMIMTMIYLVLSVIIPLEDEETINSNDSANSNSFLFGISLVFIGIILLANNLVPLYFPDLLAIIRMYSEKLIDFWPALLIILGIFILIDSNKKKNKN